MSGKLKRVVLPKSLNDEVLRAAQEFGVVSVKVFGSQLRGDVTLESDLDLLVRLAPGRDLLDLIGFKQALESVLRIRVDVVTEQGLSPYLRERILQEARPLNV